MDAVTSDFAIMESIINSITPDFKYVCNDGVVLCASSIVRVRCPTMYGVMANIYDSTGVKACRINLPTAAMRAFMEYLYFGRTDARLSVEHTVELLRITYIYDMYDLNYKVLYALYTAAIDPHLATAVYEKCSTLPGVHLNAFNYIAGVLKYPGLCYQCSRCAQMYATHPTSCNCDARHELRMWEQSFLRIDNSQVVINMDDISYTTGLIILQEIARK